MELIISKELLGEILKETVDAIKVQDNEIIYAFRVSSCDMASHKYMHDEGSINIYELAYKCKVWALNQEIDKSPKENIFKFKVLYKMDIETYKHPIEDGYSSMINPLKYGNSVNLNTFGICLNSYDSTIVNNTFESLVFYAPTEPEAIFKACQWILNQKYSHAH